MVHPIISKAKYYAKIGCSQGAQYLGKNWKPLAKKSAMFGGVLIGSVYLKGSLEEMIRTVPVTGPYLAPVAAPLIAGAAAWGVSGKIFDIKNDNLNILFQTLTKWYAVSCGVDAAGAVAGQLQALLYPVPKTATTLVATLTSVAKTIPSLGIAAANVAGVSFKDLLSYIPASVQRGTMDGAKTLGIGLVAYIAGLGAMELAGSPSGLEHLPEIAGGIASYVAAGNSRSAPIRWGSRIAAGAYTLAHAGQMPCLQDLSAWVAGKAGKSVKYVPQVIATAAAEAARLGVKYRKTIGSYCAKKAAGFTKNYVVPASGIAALGLGAYYGLPALGVSQDQAYLVSLYALALGSYGITRLSKNKLARFVGSAGALAAAAFAIDNTQILDFPGKAMAKVARDYTSDPTMLAGVRYMSNALGVAGLYAALLNATSPRSTAKPTSVP